MPQDARLQRLMDATQHLSDSVPPWDEILAGTCNLLGGDSATLIMLGGEGELLLAQQHGVSAAAEREYVEHYFAQDFMASHALGKPPGTWLDSGELFSQTQLGRNSYYVDYMRKHGMQQMTTLMLDPSDQCRCGLTVQYGAARDHVRRRLEQEVVVTFSRQLHVALTARRAASSHLFAAVADTFSAVSEAILLGTALGTICRGSSTAHALLADQNALTLRRGRLRHVDAVVDAQIALAWETVGGGSRPIRLRLPSVRGAQALLLDFFKADPRLGVSAQEANVCVRLSFADRPQPSTEQLLAAFPITAAEARVLMGLLQGDTVKRHAQKHGVSPHTVRKQVAMLMEKLACTRQTDLVRKAMAIM